MKKIIFYISLLSSLNASAGIGTSGGTPPGKTNGQLLEQLTIQAPGAGGLFIDVTGDVGLGVNVPLNSQIFVSKEKMNFQAVVLATEDFNSLKIGKNIEVTAPGELANKSYKIELGDVLGSVSLIERRQLMRISVK